jgi:uncharacterized phage protein gp47/JayE
LRERVIASYKTLPNGANRAFYEKTVLNIDGVKAATVLPKNRGLGTVDVVISTEGGVPDETLIDTVAEKLRELREICVDISVAAPEAVTVDIECAVKAEDGYDESQVEADVKAALEEYFDGGLLGKSIPVVKLGSIIYSVPGVENYAISLPAEDVTASETQLPVAGTITVTEM